MLPVLCYSYTLWTKFINAHKAILGLYKSSISIAGDILR